PALAIAHDQLYAAWYTQAEGAPRLYWTRRALAASSFEPRHVIAADLLDANDPSLAVDGDAVFAAFRARAHDDHDPWGRPGIYLGRLGGDGWTRAPDGPNSAGAPTLLSLGAARWLVAWTDGGAAASVRLARARGAAAARE